MTTSLSQNPDCTCRWCYGGWDSKDFHVPLPQHPFHEYSNYGLGTICRTHNQRYYHGWHDDCVWEYRRIETIAKKDPRLNDPSSKAF